MRNKGKAGINMQLLAIVIMSLTVVGFSIARYQNEQKINATAVTAKWLFEVYINDQKLTNEENNFKINLQDTMLNPSSALETGYIAPGSYGNFEISIDCRQCETGVEYIYELVDEDATFPDNIKFYTDENYTEKSRIIVNRQYKEYMSLEENSTVKKMKVYWKWEETDETTINAQDVANNGKNIAINLEIQGNQYIYEIQRDVTDAAYFNISETGEISLNSATIADFIKDVKNLVIPTEIGTTKVTSIANGTFAGLDNLETVQVSSGITSIGESAFVSCKNLKSVIIDDTVTSIGKNAFYDCNNISYLGLNEGLQTIESWAFDGCSAISVLNIPTTVIYIGESAFYNCTSIRQVNIPTSIDKINKWAFWNCTSIVTLVIPDNIKSIEEGAFGKCTSLYSVSFGENLPTIGDSAFYKCDSLVSNKIPKSARQ